MEKLDPFNDKSILALSEKDDERELQAMKDNSMKTKADLEGFLRRMTQQKAHVFTKKVLPQNTGKQAVNNEPSRNTNQGFNSMQSRFTEQNEVDIDAQVEAAK